MTNLFFLYNLYYQTRILPLRRGIILGAGRKRVGKGLLLPNKIGAYPIILVVTNSKPASVSNGSTVNGLEGGSLGFLTRNLTTGNVTSLHFSGQKVKADTSTNGRRTGLHFRSCIGSIAN